MTSSVAVIGLGKLGLPIAATLASKGVDVTGVDVDEQRVNAVNSGKCPLVEPGLESALAAAGERLTATTDVATAVARSDIVMIFVPTPSMEDGSFALDHVLEACRQVGEGLKDGEYKVVVVNSTVSPGATQGGVQAALEDHSGKRAGDGFGLCYSPEFVALGKVIEDFLHPDVVLIGQSDDRAGSVLEELYLRVTEHDPPVVRMGIVNAEIAKLAVNTYVTTKIAFANMLAALCERVPGGDIDAVTTALGMDSRIGPRYLRGGLGYGGPCFPRDNRALSEFARSVGVEALIPEATHTSNLLHTGEVAERVRAEVGAASTVAILGMSYRASTDIVEESPGVALAEALISSGVHILICDPLAAGPAAARLGAAVSVAVSVAECVQRADALIVAMPWEGLEGELVACLAELDRAGSVIDCWRQLDPSALPAGTRYAAIGVAPAGLRR